MNEYTGTVKNGTAVSR